MKFDVKLVESADKDLDYYKAYEQRFILKSIFKFLEVDANIETKKRKPLRPNPIAPWELSFMRSQKRQMNSKGKLPLWEAVTNSCHSWRKGQEKSKISQLRKLRKNEG
jgi:hypothetical protein